MKKNKFIARILGLGCFLLGIVFLSSCCKTVECSRGFTTVSFVKKFPPDIDTFYLRRYKLNSNFSVKIDSAIYKINQNIFVTEYKGDTVVMQKPISQEPKLFFIDAGYDYELVLPSTGELSRITEVIEGNYEQKFCGLMRKECKTEIATVKVDGISYSRTAIIK